MCTINDSHMMYGSRDMEHNRIISFYTSVPKIMIICYTVPGIQRVMGCNCYFLFWAIFCSFTPHLPLPPPSKKPKNKNFKKMKKIPGDIIILHKCAKNHDPMLFINLTQEIFTFFYKKTLHIFHKEYIEDIDSGKHFCMSGNTTA